MHWKVDGRMCAGTFGGVYCQVLPWMVPDPGSTLTGIIQQYSALFSGAYLAEQLKSVCVQHIRWRCCFKQR